MGKYGSGGGKAHCFKHGWPINAVGCENVFANEMDGIVPQGRKCSIVFKIPRNTHVVNKGVEPHIGYVVTVKRKRNPPGETLVRT